MNADPVDYFFFLWRFLDISFLCLCLRIFFLRFLTTLLINETPQMGPLLRKQVSAVDLDRVEGYGGIPIGRTDSFPIRWRLQEYSQ